MPDLKRGYRQSDVPSLRKLEQFDQIMSDNGLWGEAAVGQVAKNLEEGFIKLEPTTPGSLSSRRLRAKTGFPFVGRAQPARNVSAETWERVA